MSARLVTDYLDNTVLKMPNKVAYADDKREVSFCMVQNEAYQLATVLNKSEYFKKPVVVYLDKSVECLISFLGIAYSGNFYSPIDTKMPESRIEKIICTLSPVAVVTDNAHYTDACRIFNNSEIIVYEDVLKQDIDYIKIEENRRKIIDADILYVLFTSGSTGVPKGVIITHKSVIDYTEWVTETFNISSSSIFGNQAPFYFDNSILDIYQVVKNGASMYILPEEMFAFPVRLLEYMNEKKINTIFWVPSALCLVANLKALNTVKLKYIKKILFAGEVMPNKQLNMWRREYPDVCFANLYGPTEITDVCMYYIVDRNFKDDEPLPIGRPCKNTDILLLNEKDEQAKIGEIGEICVRGISLSLGYYKNSKKTQSAFVQNPLNDAYPEIIYRTGDLARYNEYEELMYVCRKDFQIKHMGHRIELGEIETAVSAIDKVEQNCCLYDEKRNRITLVYVGTVDGKFITDELKNSLPDYMIPNRIIRIDNMPMNLNGKIDRVKLKEWL